MSSAGERCGLVAAGNSSVGGILGHVTRDVEDGEMVCQSLEFQRSGSKPASLPEADQISRCNVTRRRTADRRDLHKG